MAIAHVQSIVATNTLAQTFNTVYASGPTNGNLLVACLFHDEAGQDLADISSSGWTRQATFDATTLTTDGRQSVWAKIAGGSESQTVAWDIGEVNRRAHGYALEFSGFVEAIADLDGATFSGGENNVGGSSIQVAASVSGRVDSLLIGLGGGWGSGLSAFSWNSSLTTQISSSANFRGSAVGWKEGAATDQPTLSWTGTRERSAIYVEIATTLATELKGSPILVI
jgi:hypothetical protein